MGEERTAGGEPGAPPAAASAGRGPRSGAGGEPARERAGGEPEGTLRALVGVTASGKSAVALELAELAGAEILSLDSMQVYRGLDVGTAKPSAAERARVPHHLVDLVDPPERYDVQRYLADASAAARDVAARGRRALFAGGTAFYLKALTHGLFEGPDVDPALRAALEARAAAEGAEALHAELARVDPVAAQRIHANDVRRVVRGLEVWQQTGRTLTAWQREWNEEAGGAERPGRPRVLVGLDLEPREHERRIRERIRGMLEAGWIEETRAIRDGVGFGPTSIQALGYREVLDHLDGLLPREELFERVVVRTRQFARRQRTWLRRFPEIEWIEGPHARRDARAVAEEARAALAE